jgi:predicted nucleic acid-binding protein
VADGYTAGVLDTCTYIDLDVLDPRELPTFPQLTSVTMAELHQGVAMAKDARSRATRTEKLGAAMADFEPLPFDGAAAARYGTLVGMALAAGRDPRPRKMDLMIAAISSAQGLPLYTRNAGDFKGFDDLVTVIAV